MADGFNSYREWLGLAASSPSYYELLGLPLQESDEGKIAAAAERARTRVRSYRPGPQAREWARLLDEIQAAKECLVDPERREQYDAEITGAANQSPELPPGCLPSEFAAAPAELTDVADRVGDLYPPAPVSSAAVVPTALQAVMPAATPELPAAATPMLPEAAATETWAASPSPLYGETAEGQIAPTPIPIAAPMAVPLPTIPESLPITVPVYDQPVMSANYEATQRATFRAAPSVMPKFNARAGRSGVKWGATAAVIGLGLVAAGLTYRLNIVARQREMAEAAAAGAAAKQSAAEMLVPKRQQMPTTAKQRTESPTALSMEEPNANKADVDTTPNSASVTKVNVTATASIPEPPEQPTSTPAPLSNASPFTAKVSRGQVQQLINTLEAAKASVVLQDFKTADSQLAKAALLAQLPSHQAAVARLKQVGEHVKKFRQALAGSVADMHAAESFQVGSTQVSFVEGKADAVILRISGKNETYRFNDMPPGLAIALADHKLAANDPASRVVKGAYLLVNKRADLQTRAKAETLWNEAQAMGASMGRLLPYLNDDYAAFRNDATE